MTRLEQIRKLEETIARQSKEKTRLLHDRMEIEKEHPVFIRDLREFSIRIDSDIFSNLKSRFLDLINGKIGDLESCILDNQRILDDLVEKANRDYVPDFCNN